MPATPPRPSRTSKTRVPASSTTKVTTPSPASTVYGEEIGSGTGRRTTAQGFGSSNTPRQKYGLTERDEAVGLDHTWLRKHENRADRWTSPDPYGGSMSPGDPQNFDRFNWVSGQPTNSIDPSGLRRIQQRTRTWINYSEMFSAVESDASVDGSGSKLKKGSL